MYYYKTLLNTRTAGNENTMPNANELAVQDLRTDRLQCTFTRPGGTPTLYGTTRKNVMRISLHAGSRRFAEM